MTLPPPLETQRVFTLADFDFHLPPELIAQHPPAERSGSRLLDGRQATPADRRFAELADLLNPGDLLVFNDTQVVKARLYGQKTSGGRLELLIERVLESGQGLEVAAHMKVSKKPLPGAVLQMDGGFTATLIGRWPAPRREPSGAPAWPHQSAAQPSVRPRRRGVWQRRSGSALRPQPSRRA